MFPKKYLVYLKNFDWILFGSFFLLICFGLAAIYSITISSDQPDFSNFKKQITFTIIGLVIVSILTMIDYHYWHDFSLVVYGLVFVPLILVLFLGRTISGTTGWFSFFGINFQPVEIAKISLIICLAWFFSHVGENIKQLKNFIISAIIVGSYFGLVILQPDFGSGMILIGIWFLMIIFAGVNKRHLLVSGILLAIVAVIAWFFLFHDYQQARIMTFFNPQADPYGRGYHVRQAVTAVGAGGLFGRGLGFGSQSQLKFIPASETDFIFAVIAEELGFFGVSLVLFFWAIIFYRLIKIAKQMKDSFALYFVLGVSALFFCQLMVNIGMNIGLVPVTGISLPFLSYGGSFLVVSMAAIGMVEGMIVKNRLASS
ncbi:MAG: rod shape-determining protein RodA [Patescibacteria group bacterium]|nr:rod shape-determining protein RodA [Patescibacteria group bacterium]